MKKSFKRILSILLTVSLLFSTSVFTNVLAASSASEDPAIDEETTTLEGVDLSEREEPKGEEPGTEESESEKPELFPFIPKMTLEDIENLNRLSQNRTNESGPSRDGPPRVPIIRSEHDMVAHALAVGLVDYNERDNYGNNDNNDSSDNNETRNSNERSNNGTRDNSPARFTFFWDFDYVAYVQGCNGQLGYSEALVSKIMSYDIENLSPLRDRLTQENYSQTDIDTLCATIDTVFDLASSDEGHWLDHVRNCLANLKATIQDEEMRLFLAEYLFQEYAISDGVGMLEVMFDYFDELYERIAVGIVESQMPMSIAEYRALVMELYPQYLQEFEEFLAEAISGYQEYTSPWLVAAYLANLSTLESTKMINESFGIGAFEYLASTSGFQFRHDPSKSYGNFLQGMGLIAQGSASLSPSNLFSVFNASLLESQLDGAEPLKEALMNEEYSPAEADAFMQRMAEVFAYESMHTIKQILVSEDPQATFVEMLTTLELAANIEDMVEVMYDYYTGTFENVGQGLPISGTIETFLIPWVIAGYLHNFAAINDIDIAPGSITPYVYPIRNYALKEELARQGITIGFAEAEEIDVELVDVDEPTMQALTDAIMAQDMADLGLLFSSILLAENATPDDITIALMLLAVLNFVNLGELDMFSLTDLLKMFASFTLEELLDELETINGVLAEALETAGISAEGMDLGEVVGRITNNLVLYSFECWSAIKQEVGALFDPQDDTLDYVMAWVTTLYLQNIKELNVEEEEIVLEKAGGPISKQARQSYEAPEKKLFDENGLKAVVDDFALDSSEIYAILDVGTLLERCAEGEFDVDEYLAENPELREAVMRTADAAMELMARVDRESGRKLSVARTVLRVASKALSDSDAYSCENCGSVSISPTWSGRVRNANTVFRKSPKPAYSTHYNDTKSCNAGFQVKNIKSYMIVDKVKWYLCDADDNSFTDYWVQASNLENCWVTTPKTGAANLQAYLTANNVAISTPSNSKIDISVSGNTVTLTTGFNYSGTLNNSTRRTLFESGISRWTGTRTMLGYSVTLNVVIDNNRVTDRKINVTMYDELGVSHATLIVPVAPTTTQNHSIHIYKGDSRISHTYTDGEFEYAASHEFGHIIGLHDAYNLSDPPRSVMNEFGTPVQARDVERVIKAYATMTTQAYD